MQLRMLTDEKALSVIDTYPTTLDFMQALDEGASIINVNASSKVRRARGLAGQPGDAADPAPARESACWSGAEQPSCHAVQCR
jgi:hypothetical protein